MKTKKNLTVFCGARWPKLSADDLDLFKSQLRKLIIPLTDHYNLVYGGGQVGLMGFVADTFIQNKAHTTGVIPHYLNTIEIQHLGVTLTEVVDDLHERKAKMEKLADAFLILPGGIGTLDELCEVLTLQSLKRQQNKVYIWNWNKLYDPFFDFIHKAQGFGFISEDLLSECVIRDNYEDLVKKLL